MIHQCVFMIRNSRVTVYCARGERFEYLRNEGEKSFPIPDHFWDWWKEKVSYLSEDLVDFCFIFDENNESVFSDPFLKSAGRPAESCWNRSFLTKFFGDAGVLLRDPVYLMGGKWEEPIVVGPDPDTGKLFWGKKTVPLDSASKQSVSAAKKGNRKSAASPTDSGIANNAEVAEENINAINAENMRSETNAESDAEDELSPLVHHFRLKRIKEEQEV